MFAIGSYTLQDFKTSEELETWETDCYTGTKNLLAGQCSTVSYLFFSPFGQSRNPFITSFALRVHWSRLASQKMSLR